MAKTSFERLQLSDLMVCAMKLQEVAKVLRREIDSDDNLASALGSVRLALDALVIKILERHLDEVELRLDPRQPCQPQDWQHDKAVLEIVHEGLIIRMPVPKLRVKNPGLADKVRRKLTMSTIRVIRSWSDGMIQIEVVGVIQSDKPCCSRGNHCFHSGYSHTFRRILKGYGRVEKDQIIWRTGGWELPTHGGDPRWVDDGTLHHPPETLSSVDHCRECGNDHSYIAPET